MTRTAIAEAQRWRCDLCGAGATSPTTVVLHLCPRCRDQRRGVVAMTPVWPEAND